MSSARRSKANSVPFLQANIAALEAENTALKMQLESSRRTIAELRQSEMLNRQAANARRTMCETTELG